MSDTSRASDIYRQFQGYIQLESTRSAFRTMLEAGGALEPFEMESYYKGAIRDVRFYLRGEKAQPFSFIVNKNSLLFYLRKPAVTSGKYHLSNLEGSFANFSAPRDTEWTIRVTDVGEANEVVRQILAAW